MKNRCEKAGRHTYLVSEPKPRWCIWCGTMEEEKVVEVEKVIEEKAERAPKKKKKKSNKKK